MEAVLYASGSRRLTVEHGQPLIESAAALLQQLVDGVDQAVTAARHLGGGTVAQRPTSITWTFPASDVPARDLVLAVGSPPIVSTAATGSSLPTNKRQALG